MYCVDVGEKEPLNTISLPDTLTDAVIVLLPRYMMSFDDGVLLGSDAVSKCAKT